MAFRTMKFSVRYSTHLPVLLRAMQLTTGDVLELGAGIFSTPVLHWLCTLHKRSLVSYDNDPRFTEWAAGLAGDYHKILYVEDWDDADIEKSWDVVLVDHSPSERRIVEITRLRKLARYMVIHDSNGRYHKFYHYNEIYPLFKYKYTFDKVEPSTTVLSNSMPLVDFMEGFGYE